MIGSFDCWPKRVIVGAGAINGIADMIKEMGRKSVLIFTGPHLATMPVIKGLVEQIEKAGLRAGVFSDLGANPTVEMAEKAVEYMNDFQPEALVCFGGGSPIDTGKAANVVFTHGGTPVDYDVAAGGIMKIQPRLLPMIIVPTTAGSGTEVTNVGVLTNEEKQTKFGILSPYLIPDISILDPEVTVSMSPRLTANTGIDALTHCIEAYTSSVDFAPGDAIALEGIRLIGKSLRAAVKNGADLDARENMLVASMMGGTAFSLNGLGACHAMAHQLSAFFDMAHGEANAILLPVVMEYNLEAKQERFAKIAEALGADISKMTEKEAAEKALEMVKKLSEDVNIPKYLDDAGATKEAIPGMVERALLDNPLTTNPRPAGAKEIEALYLKAFR